MTIERWRPFEVSTDRWEPFRNVSEMQNEVNRLFESFFGRPASRLTQAGHVWAPALDMYETKDDLVLAFEMPGVREKDVSVSITGDLLSVRGERRFEAENKERNDVHLERVYGKFERVIQLPMAVQADKVKATYGDGVLEIRLPKADEVRPREIKIDIV